MMNDSTRTAAADSEPGKSDAITGEPRVDEALGTLAGLGELPDAGHVEAYERVYQRLRGLLGELDTAVPPMSPPRHASPAAQVSHAAHGRPVPHDHADGQAQQA